MMMSSDRGEFPIYYTCHSQSINLGSQSGVVRSSYILVSIVAVLYVLLWIADLWQSYRALIHRSQRLCQLKRFHRQY